MIVAPQPISGERAEGASKSAGSAPDLDPLTEQIQLAVERALPASVAVVQRHGGNRRAAFSAVIVSPEGHILTAGHCIQPGRAYEIILNDGRTLPAVALGRSNYLDCGLMKITGEGDFAWAELGHSGQLVRNQPCLSFGHPGGYDERRGLVIRFGRVVSTNARGHIQNTCLMEPGDSGGGLFDLEGRVIGVHSYIAQDLSDNFDIPVDLFRNHWDQLCKTEEFAPPYAIRMFGIELASRRATERGAEVASVVQSSPADDAGLVAGDEITVINDTLVSEGFRTSRELWRLFRQRNSTVRLTVQRDDDSHKLTIRRQTPTTPPIRDLPNPTYPFLEDLSNALQNLETRMDDCAVQIRSVRADRRLETLGTIVNRNGWVVSKSSQVDESPVVIDDDGEEHSATILGRDADNDIVLLQVEGKLPSGVDLDSVAHLKPGHLLLSVRPGSPTGFVSLFGSKTFRSPRQQQTGYLGVVPGSQDQRVILQRILDGPGKQAGLKTDDIILKVNDQPITATQQLIATIGSREPGSTVRLLIQRGAEEQVVTVVLGIRPDHSRRHVADSFAGGPSLRRTGFESVFCHDAHAEPEQCGGPIFDLTGQFIGINIARYSRTCSYALPGDLVRQSVERIQQQQAL